MSLLDVITSRLPKRVERVPVFVPAVGLENFGASAHYEGAWPSPERQTLMSSWQDADEDSAWYREQLAEKARELDRNSTLFSGIVERMVTYGVGNGVNPDPITSDQAFNEEAADAWEETRNVLDLETDFSWDDVVSVIYGTALVEGMIYTVKTYDAGEPKIQLIDMHRMAGKDRKSDGVEYDSNGKPKNYRCLLTRDRKGNATTIEAEFVIPHYFPRRARQHFGVTIFAPAINRVQDIDEIIRFEKQAVKYTSSIIEVIENATGEASGTLTAARWGKATPDRVDSATSANEAVTWYQRIFGAAVRFVRKGEKYTQYAPQRPSPTWLGMMDFLTATVCMPTGMPPSTILPIKMGGADSRRDLATAARVIERHQRRLSHQLQGIYEHVIDWKLGRRGRPKDWRRAEWQYPRSITCDYGRQAQQDREDLGMGAQSLRNYCGDNGLGSPRKYLRARAQDVTLRDLAAKEENEVRAGLDLEPMRPEQVFNFDYKSQAGDPTPAPGQEAPLGAEAGKASQEGVAA